ncbi:MAG TPA: DNA-binding protein, partial [Thermoanaerobaculia bacterium]|nr:DNA-binding protein [Thermoanaerobaculia bacterium]
MLLWFLQSADYFWRNPLAGARFVRLTDFEGAAQAAAISRDGRLVAFVSDRDGPVDVWLTQIGTGQLHNLTHGKVRELVNPDVRTLGFSPDGKFVTAWVRKQSVSDPNRISVWAIPSAGGEPAPYFEGVAEFDWSHDGSRVVYHTPGPGDPTFVNDRTRHAQRRIFTAPPGIHAHFPTWSTDDAFIYFVYGRVPNDMDIWRISPSGGTPERMTWHKSRVTYPTFIDARTLLYLANDANGGGPWLYQLDVKRRRSRRISFGVERYTSLSGSLDGRRLVVTVADTKRTLWRIPILDSVPDESAAAPVALPTNGARAPRIGRGYLLFISSTGEGDSIWKLANGSAKKLWNAPRGRIIGGMAISPEGRIAFSAEAQGRRRMYAMNADGSDARVVAESLDAQGTPAWAPDGQIAVGATVNGKAGLVKVSADGRTVTPLETGFAADPVWSPDGASVLYSGPDVGTTFQIRGASAAGSVQPEPKITLSRGARRVVFFPGQRALVVLRGSMSDQNFWLIDLTTGRERPLTNFSRNFMIDDFDISPDGREIVFDRKQDSSDIVMIDR